MAARSRLRLGYVGVLFELAVQPQGLHHGDVIGGQPTVPRPARQCLQQQGPLGGEHVVALQLALLGHPVAQRQVAGVADPGVDRRPVRVLAERSAVLGELLQGEVGVAPQTVLAVPRPARHLFQGCDLLGVQKASVVGAALLLHPVPEPFPLPAQAEGNHPATGGLGEIAQQPVELHAPGADLLHQSHVHIAQVDPGRQVELNAPRRVRRHDVPATAKQ